MSWPWMPEVRQVQAEGIDVAYFIGVGRLWFHSISAWVFLLCFFADAAAALGMPRNRGEWVSWPLGGVAVCGSVLSVCLSIFQVPSGPPLELDEDLR